jgi:hypothetical protein
MAWPRIRESQTLTFLADALSVLDRLRRTAGGVLRKWKKRFRKAGSRYNPADSNTAQPRNCGLRERRMTLKKTEDCGLSAGILPAHAQIYNWVFP